jgi:hypothetical protein
MAGNRYREDPGRGSAAAQPPTLLWAPRVTRTRSPQVSCRLLRDVALPRGRTRGPVRLAPPPFAAAGAAGAATPCRKIAAAPVFDSEARP